MEYKIVVGDGENVDPDAHRKMTLLCDWCVVYLERRMVWENDTGIF